MSQSRISINLKRVSVLALATFVQACSLNVPIDKPGVSELAYVQQGDIDSITLKLEDKLGDNHQLSTSSPLTINLKHEGSAIDPAPFVFSSLKKELAARQLSVSYSDQSDTVLDLEKFNIISHRSNGFSPMVTISTLKAELQTREGTKTIASMVKRGKVPIWTMSEINDPCYSQPFELMIKEFAAKINSSLFHYSLADADVMNLVEKIKQESESNDLVYFDVYELGFSNNPNAIEPLKEFSQSENEYVRLAAISSLGILGATQYFDDLKSIYLNANLWQDRGMALKAIGDLGTEQALAFIASEKSKWSDQATKEAKWNMAVINLYID
jgi:hypothetical protein